VASSIGKVCRPNITIDGKLFPMAFTQANTVICDLFPVQYAVGFYTCHIHEISCEQWKAPHLVVGMAYMFHAQKFPLKAESSTLAGWNGTYIVSMKIS